MQNCLFLESAKVCVALQSYTAIVTVPLVFFANVCTRISLDPKDVRHSTTTLCCFPKPNLLNIYNPREACADDSDSSPYVSEDSEDDAVEKMQKKREGIKDAEKQVGLK
jgi:hypothetical protein